MGDHHMILAGEWLLSKPLASKLSFLAGEWLLGKPLASRLCFVAGEWLLGKPLASRLYLFIDPQGRSGINAP